MQKDRRRARGRAIVGVVALALALTPVGSSEAAEATPSPAQAGEPTLTKTLLLTPDGQARRQVVDAQGQLRWVWPQVVDINNPGQIVGSIPGDDLAREPLLWDGESRAVALPAAAGSANEVKFINDAGQVTIGRRLWDDGVVTDLPAGYGYVDINESGQLLLDDDDGSIALWDDGQLTRIPPPADASNGLHAFELSDAGHIVGYSSNASLPIPGCTEYGHRPFIWHQGTMTRPQVSGIARAVNRSGATVVSLNLTGMLFCLPSYDALTWADGTSRDLGSIVQPIDINDRGQVVGNDERGAYLWDDGRLTNLGSLGGGGAWATGPIALNERGQVLGLSRTADGVTHGFVWTSGHMLDLGPVGEGYPAYPQDINDQGQIIGYDVGDPSVPDDTTAVMWQVHDPNIPTDPSEQACVRATNPAHVQAGRATSVLLFTWAAGSGTYLGTTSQTTSLRETAPGRWELVDTC